MDAELINVTAIAIGALGILLGMVWIITRDPYPSPANDRTQPAILITPVHDGPSLRATILGAALLALGMTACLLLAIYALALEVDRWVW